MKRRFSFLCLLIVLGGCVGPAISPSKEHVAQVKHVHVVAMEARPLGVPPGFRSQLPIQAAGSSITAVRCIAVFNTIAMFLEMPEASRRGDDASKSLQAVLDANGAWSPTITLANEVAKQLVANGIDVNVAPGVKPIPGVQDRSATMTMENWLGPIRAHYNNLAPVPDYRALASGQPLFVLEVGISNYEITGASLLLQVHLKMIDAVDGRVIGRARAANAGKTPSLQPLDQAFANDASRFKEAFLDTSRQLTKQCLTELALLQSAN